MCVAMKAKNKIGRPKKSKGTHLVLCSVALRPDQIDFLKSLGTESRSAAVRYAVDFLQKNVRVRTLEGAQAN